MSCHLQSLPDDVLFDIIARLSVQDLLSLIQTCRGFHALGTTDYVWHSIDTDELPLDISVGMHPRVMSGPDLRHAWVKGLRLERNWSQHASEPKRMCRIKQGDSHIVFQNHILGSDWLITLSRAPTSALCLSLWYTGVPHKEFRYASLEVPFASKFAASTRKEGTEAIIAVVLDATRATNVNVYSIPLDVDDHDRSILAMPHLIGRIARPHSEGTPGEIHVCDGIVVVAVAHFGDIFSPPNYRFIVLDVDTHQQLDIRPALPDVSFQNNYRDHADFLKHFTHVQFRLFPQHLTIAGLKVHERLAVRTYDFTPVRVRLQKSSIQLASLDDNVDLLREYLSEDESDEVPADSDFALSAGYMHRGVPKLTALLFHASAVSSLLRHGTASVFSFPAERDSRCPSSHGAMPLHVFSTPTSAVSDIVCLGRTGHRSVWLERRWDTDTFTLMKATFSPEGSHAAVVERLLPMHFTLPFATFSIQSMAFDESTGRVCLGLHTGELYILAF